MASVHAPIWARLKEKHSVKLQLPMTNLTPAQMPVEFKRIRKALSDLKMSDASFQRAQPHARLEVVTRDVNTGIMELKLIYVNVAKVLDLD